MNPKNSSDIPTINGNVSSTVWRPVPPSVTILNESTPLLSQQQRTISLSNDTLQRRKERLGVILLGLSALSFTAMSACVKLSSEKSFGSFEIVFARSIVQLFLSLVTCGIGKINPLGNIGIRRWLLFRALVMSIGLSLFFYSLTTLPLLDATVLFSLGPVFTSIIASIALDERFTSLDTLCSISCLVGVVFVTKPGLFFTFNLVPEKTSHFGIECALLGAIMSAMSYITVRKVGKNIHFLVHSVYFGAISTFISPPGLFLFQKLYLPSDWIPVAYLLLVGVFAFIGQCLLNKGLKLAPTGIGIFTCGSDILFAWMAGSFFFQEYSDSHTIFGSFIIMTMTTLLGLQKLKHRTNRVVTNQAARKRQSRERLPTSMTTS
ncbi:uncharacterized protein BX664DRAFT_340102 [Halteromyces radiatus]|uniref:uncharacterized protein n=1 Tax=Halteromyces radiatus TaxID=101107 RepID=UPI00221E8FC6|nr:uncharacterized protein BX664DRAFT_340102 [Halteromyces radiatus]KAI8081312.1 hypothetical protein BX664DRAFT_340102 [Halteromyces radiatus]